MYINIHLYVCIYTYVYTYVYIYINIYKFSRTIITSWWGSEKKILSIIFIHKYKLITIFTNTNSCTDILSYTKIIRW
jgi:hypothetical protein